MIIRKFSKCPVDVKNQLFRSYVSCLYTAVHFGRIILLLGLNIVYFQRKWIRQD